MTSEEITPYIYVPNDDPDLEEYKGMQFTSFEELEKNCPKCIPSDDDPEPGKLRYHVLPTSIFD